VRGALEGSASPYRGLLFDFSGVLTTDLFVGYRALCRDQGLPENALFDFLTQDDEGHRLLVNVERGVIGQEEFERRVGRGLGIDGSSLVQRVWGYLRPETKLLEFVDDVRGRGVRAGVVSNSLGVRPFDPYALWGITDRFDTVVLSGEVGLRKPEPEIFRLSLDRLGVTADKCVFIDDMAHNLEAARVLGLTTVHHTDPDATVAELSDLLGLRQSPPSSSGSSSASGRSESSSPNC